MGPACTDSNISVLIGDGVPMIKTVHSHQNTPEADHDPIVVSSRSFGPSWNSSIVSVRNARKDCFKPNEDCVVVDPTRQSVVIADGITRTKRADGSYPIPSPSAAAAALFCETVSQALAREPIMNNDVLRKVVEAGNAALATYNREHFPHPDFSLNDVAGVAAIVGVVDDKHGRLWVAQIADCWAMAATPISVDRLAWEKTSHAADEYKRIGEQEARRTLRNNFRSSFGYGAFTGEEAAMRFVQFQCFALEYKQRLIFATDGLLNLASEKPYMLGHSTAHTILAEACDLEARLDETDDKTMVILDRIR